MFRIAPTPSGFLHLGNAFSFLLTRQLADRHGKKIFLRIDDLDSDRKRPEYVRDIFESLDWLGIAWEAGPKDPDDFERNWSQQFRLQQYRDAIGSLTRKGRVFTCRCSRSQLTEYGGRYPGVCRESGIQQGTPDTALRMEVPVNTLISFSDSALGQQVISLDETTGSFVIERRDGLPAYQLASVVDDHLFGVTVIVRGTDLLISTAAQLYLAEALGFSAFSNSLFLHHRLLTDGQGSKLSKSEGALSLKSLRESGVHREEIMERLLPWIQEYLPV